MNWSVEGRTKAISNSNPQRIAVVRDSLKKWLSALPDDSRLSLISFNTNISAPEEFHFAKAQDREAVVRWAEKLDSPPNGDTHLWATLREALKVARRYAAESPGQPIIVRIFTDGENEDHSPETGTLTMKEVLDGFPEVDGKRLRPDLVLLGKDLSMEAIAMMKADKRVGIIQNPNFDLNSIDFRPIIAWRPAAPVEGQPVTFFDNSQSPYKSYQWILDERPLSNSKVLDVTSLSAGKHTVVLKVIHLDDQPNFSTATFEVAKPTVSPPNPAFSVDKQVFTIGETINFTAQENKDGYVHQWQVGEAATLTGEKAVWISDRHGQINIKHRVTAPHGSAEATLPILGQKQEQPDSSFAVDKQIFTEGETVTFKANKANPAWKHEWIIENGPTLSGEQVSWKSDRSGQIKIIHRVRSSRDVSEFSMDVVSRKNELPNIKFSASQSSGQAPLTVQFHDESTRQERIACYEWDFGDGMAGSSDKNPVHTFDLQGKYAVHLKVTTIDHANLAASEPLAIDVLAPPPVWRKWIWPAIAAFLALLLFAKILGALRPKPIYGNLAWQYQGKKGTKVLSGTSFDLKNLGVAGWNPPHTHVIRNKNGIQLFSSGGTTRPLKNAQSINVDGLTLTFTTNLK